MLISLSVDYHGADVATRERFHIPPERLPRVYALGGDGVREVALLATCNRTEMYAWCPGVDPLRLDRSYAALARRWAPAPSEARALLAVAARRAGGDAARHAIRVAVGLESQVLGDGQILGQFRAAYQEGSAAGAIGNVLHRLFETALRAGKRSRGETQLGSGRNSVGAQAAALAARRFGNLTHTRIVVVGCGKTGERVARQLHKLGARDLVLLNRTPERAAVLARALGGRAAPMDAVHAEVAMADIAVVATGSAVPLVHAGSLSAARRNCATVHYPLLVIDLSMPRNVDASAAALPGVTIVDLDALRPQVTATEELRRAAVPAAEVIVDVESVDFDRWLTAAAARLAIQPLREALAAVCRSEVAFAAGDEAADRIADRIVAKVLARPMLAVRDALARGESAADLTRTLAALFPDGAPPRAAADALAGDAP